MADPWAKDWQELTSDEGTAAIVLGYDEGTWSVRDESSPDSCCKTWELLSEAQQRAASVLGYDQARWDAEYEGPQVSAEEELWTAAESSDPEAVSRALTRDPALDKLHGTAFCQQTVLHLSCGGGDLEVVKVLLEARAEVNATDDEGATPLHRVSFQGHFEVAKALLEAGADLEISPPMQSSPTPPQDALAQLLVIPPKVGKAFNSKFMPSPSVHFLVSFFSAHQRILAWW